MAKPDYTRAGIAASFADFNLRDVRLSSRVLGAGSFGEVVVANWGGTVCAAKRLHKVFSTLLPESTTGSIIKRYLQECKTWSQLRPLPWCRVRARRQQPTPPRHGEDGHQLAALRGESHQGVPSTATQGVHSFPGSMRNDVPPREATGSPRSHSEQHLDRRTVHQGEGHRLRPYPRGRRVSYGDQKRCRNAHFHATRSFEHKSAPRQQAGRILLRQSHPLHYYTQMANARRQRKCNV